MKKKKSIKWIRLDNAAKIFPSTSGKKDTKVFRFSCELFDFIDGIILQEALNKTIEDFPSFQSILRRGLFWYYFEETDKKAIVTEEAKPPCSRIFYKNKKNLFFEVSYYKKRINLEVHHTLTDGTGAMEFLKELIYHYILIKYANDFKEEKPALNKDASLYQKEDDSFQKYYTKGEKELNSTKKKMKKAYKLKGLRYFENRIRVIEGVLPVKQVLEKAHEYDVTLSVFITAVFIYSIGKELSMLNKRKPVVVAVPVNLRNFFPSESVRNFFSVFHVSYNFSKQSDNFEDVLQCVKQQFQIGLDVENLKRRLNFLASYEHNIFMRAIPLFIKDFVLKFINIVSDAGITASVSNIGKVTMTEEFKKYIHLFDIFISTTKIQICFCSYGEHLVLSFTSPYLNTEIQKNFFRMFAQWEIPVEITVNPMTGDE